MIRITLRAYESKLKTKAPGFIGAGIGLPVTGIRRGSQLGYAYKLRSQSKSLPPRRRGALQF